MSEIINESVVDFRESVRSYGQALRVSGGWLG